MLIHVLIICTAAPVIMSMANVNFQLHIVEVLKAYKKKGTFIKV